MRHPFILVVVFAFGTVNADAQTSSLWREYVEAKQDGRTPTLPDFSYAGYHAGERGVPDVVGPVFDVVEYGARPNDGKDDQQAIQDCIDAAEKAGGGVVRFAAGQYDVNTDIGNRRPLRVRASHIVLRGAGMGPGGTVLRIHQPTMALERDVDLKMGGGFLQVGPEESPDASRLALVIADSPRESHELRVDQPEQFTPGMWVSLRTRGPGLVDEVIKPYKREDLPTQWTRILGDGFYRTEHHTVAEVRGDTLVLREPLKTPVREAAGFELTRYTPITEIGIEDIAFVGGWLGKFSHHRSRMDDSGWSGMRLNHVADSWVRRCAFINFNGCFTFESSAYSSALHNVLAGTMGHVSIGSPRRSTGILVGLSLNTMERDGARDTSHGIGSAGGAGGNVYWRFTMHPEESCDMHGNFPYATLFDCVVGGNLGGSGGPVASFPNHLEQFVVWNFRHRSEPRRSYDFWSGRRPNVVAPIVVGMHGAPAQLNESSVGLNESQGRAVEPESLYESQLARRLGGLPAWVQEAKATWASMDKQMPAFERGGDNTPSVAAQRAEIIRWILATPVVKSRYSEDDPLQGLLDEWPTRDGSPWTEPSR